MSPRETEHWWVFATGRHTPGCPGCTARRRRQLRVVSFWLLTLASWILIGWAFPARGLLGIFLGVTGLTLSACALAVRAGGR